MKFQEKLVFETIYKVINRQACCILQEAQYIIYLCLVKFLIIIGTGNMIDNKPKICVAGSSNYDLIAYTDRLPQLGEIIHGNKFEMGFGGKGANQAVAAGKLGEDVFGKQTIENFKNCGINTDYVYFTDKASSGVAPISVDKNGNNSIIVVAGANNLITQSLLSLHVNQLLNPNF